jgi:hypothetical protein
MLADHVELILLANDYTKCMTANSNSIPISKYSLIMLSSEPTDG